MASILFTFLQGYSIAGEPLGAFGAFCICFARVFYSRGAMGSILHALLLGYSMAGEPWEAFCMHSY